MIKNNQAKSLIALVIISAVIILALRIAIEQVVRISIAQNETNALNTLRIISTALENYAKDNSGVFPSSLVTLSETKPAYLDKSYLNQPYMKSYNYICSRLEPSGYSCSAMPVKCNLTGKKNYLVVTGGSLISEDCDKKE